MTTKFTPGPWETDGAKDQEHHYYEVIAPMPKPPGDKFNYVVADTLNRHHCISPDEDSANARLIAAAPEMYWSLKGLLDLSDLMQRFGADGMNPEWKAGVLSDARAVLAKANGGAA